MNEPKKLHSQYIMTHDELPLAVFEAGDPQGHPVLFLHGFGYSHAAFKPQFESDLADDFRLLAIDLRGHGYSAKPWSRSDYAGTEVWANDLELVLDTLNVSDVTLVGWSYGAMVCMDWIRNYGSARAKNFIFTGSHGGLVPYTKAELQAKHRVNEQLRGQVPNFDSDWQNAKNFIETMVKLPVSDEMHKTLLASRQMLPHYAQQAMGSRAFENSDLKTTINRPVMFIQGEYDFANPPSTIEAAAKTVPMSRVEIIAGAGHIPSMEAPEEFNTLLREFADTQTEKWINHEIR